MISDAVPQTTFNKTDVKFSCNYNESSLPPQVLISTWFDCLQTGFLKGTLGNSESSSNASHTLLFLSLFKRQRHALTHLETFLLTGWCLSCRFPYSVSVSWGREEHFWCDWRITQTPRGSCDCFFFLEWSGLFSAPGSMFIFHKSLSDNVSFCWHWASRSQRLIETRTD